MVDTDFIAFVVWVGVTFTVFFKFKTRKQILFNRAMNDIFEKPHRYIDWFFLFRFICCAFATLSIFHFWYTTEACMTNRIIMFIYWITTILERSFIDTLFGKAPLIHAVRIEISAIICAFAYVYSLSWNGKLIDGLLYFPYILYLCTCHIIVCRVLQKQSVYIPRCAYYGHRIITHDGDDVDVERMDEERGEGGDGSGGGDIGYVPAITPLSVTSDS